MFLISIYDHFFLEIIIIHFSVIMIINWSIIILYFQRIFLNILTVLASQLRLLIFSGTFL